MRQVMGLRAENLCKRFGHNQALDGLSLQVNRGEVVGLFGRDGAGKTVTFETMMGLTSLDSGRVLLDDQDITGLTIDRRAPLGVSYLAQEPSIFRAMTVAENIDTVLEVCQSDPVKRSERLEELLEEFGLGYVRDTPTTRLSGGERRRTEVARAMAASPAYVLLDEPFSGIDPLSVNSIKSTITKLRSLNIGVMMSDQNVRETLPIMDRVYVIHLGQLIFDGKPTAMLADATVQQLYLGEQFNR
jgi:lipopolysaccharide export system ATP-binding protein